jgi:hypothetical protein
VTFRRCSLRTSAGSASLRLELTRRNERRSLTTSVRGYRIIGLGNDKSLLP